MAKPFNCVRYQFRQCCVFKNPINALGPCFQYVNYRSHHILQILPLLPLSIIVSCAFHLWPLAQKGQNQVSFCYNHVNMSSKCTDRLTRCLLMVGKLPVIFSDAHPSDQRLESRLAKRVRVVIFVAA